jgi:hypothetical protein
LCVFIYDIYVISQYIHIISISQKLMCPIQPGVIRVRISQQIHIISISQKLMCPIQPGVIRVRVTRFTIEPVRWGVE